ncbi:MAG: tRNA uridine-5-carboxymethylaminomethyl(34) synthesis GTPase MnmE [Clostridia bacterium]|nr:tRNA uridine-5-carboxymethylaminomethyl(34) synthesis GTPase MnmE [Clostridia bacterium]
MRTVAAISTPYGKGGVALIRITGEDAIAIAQKVAIRTGKGTLSDALSATAVRVTFEDGGIPFDDGLATVFRAPRSFTGEDVVELCCHGGILVTQKLLGAVFTAGAFPAGPGEFTRRAFQNGKLSLSQAEAVGGLIDAKSDKYLTVSLLQCRGALSEKLQRLCDKLRFLIASVYAFIDYPDEDMTDVTVEEMKERLTAICGEVQTLCDSHAYGKAISEGIPVCILGKPNTGKSALLNALAREDRAIVTAIPGTTRDVVKEQIRLGDLLLNLSDTAGIRESEDVVERLGIERSLRSLEEAELVLAVFDSSRPFDEEDREVLRLIRDHGKEEQTVYLLNKGDLPEAEGVRSSLPKVPVCISAMEKTGLDALEAAVKERFAHTETDSLGEIVVGARQFAALTKARGYLQDALRTLEGFSQDMAGLDMENALQALEEVDGKTASDEIVSEIFSHFCVGK